MPNLMKINSEEEAQEEEEDKAEEGILNNTTDKIFQWAEEEASKEGM